MNCAGKPSRALKPSWRKPWSSRWNVMPCCRITAPISAGSSSAPSPRFRWAKPLPPAGWRWRAWLPSISCIFPPGENPPAASTRSPSPGCWSYTAKPRTPSSPWGCCRDRSAAGRSTSAGWRSAAQWSFRLRSSAAMGSRSWPAARKKPSSCAWPSKRASVSAAPLTGNSAWPKPPRWRAAPPH